MANTTINNDIAKRVIFAQEFKSVIEDKNVFSPVATKLLSSAKNIFSPYTAVGAARAHTTPCVVPVTDLVISKDELVLDRYIGNAILDCKDVLDWADFDVTGMTRRDLYASVIKRANQYAGADFVADATSNGGTVGLSTSALIQAWLISVASNAAYKNVGLRNSVDGARVVRAPLHDQPFVVAGNTAFNTILAGVASILSPQTVGQLMSGDVTSIKALGVNIINGTGVWSDEKQMLWGVGGALTMAYREDDIQVDMGSMRSISAYSGASSDLDLADGDTVLKNTYFISAQTKGKNGIFANVQSLVTQGKMA